MTISIAWHRKFAGVDEVICASDSRLSAGYRWDCAQKIFPIDGPNFCISFAGDTDFAFPCIFQFQTMVKNYQRFSDGAAPISTLTKDFLAIVNQLLGLVDDDLLANFTQTQFLISGYDFATGDPYLKKIVFDPALGRYQRHPGGGLKAGGVSAAVSFIGDQYVDFFRHLAKVISKAGTEIDYQPLEALSEFVAKQSKESSIGGQLQVVKVYRHRNYLPYGVRDKDGEQVSLFGRPLLEYEQTRYPILSLNGSGIAKTIEYPNGVPERTLKGPEKI